MDLPSVPIPDGHPRIYPTLSALWAVGFTVMKGMQRPSACKRGDPSKPLAAAAERLRGKPGRPRKDGHVSGIAAQQKGMDSGHNRGALAVTAIAPRLLDVHTSARYLGISSWTVRDLIANGTLARVRVPLSNGRELRKVLLDREELDRLVEAWKERHA